MNSYESQLNSRSFKIDVFLEDIQFLDAKQYVRGQHVRAKYIALLCYKDMKKLRPTA